MYMFGVVGETHAHDHFDIFLSKNSSKNIIITIFTSELAYYIASNFNFTNLLSQKNPTHIT